MTDAVVNTPTPWVPATGVEADIIGHIQTKGWDKLSPAEAAVAATRAHREAEKLIGVPSTQLLRLPSDPKDEAGWKTIYQRLGAPADVKDYDFTGVKFADGTALPEGLVQALRDVSGRTHQTKDGAVDVASVVAKYLDNDKATKLAEYTAGLEASKAALQKNWGANFDANTVIARNAAAALGVSKEDITALEKVVGFDRVMELFRSIGTKIGEDKFVVNPVTNAGVMTREQAVAKKNELMRDAGWTKRYMDGGVQENAELQALIRIIAGDDTDASRQRTGR